MKSTACAALTAFFVILAGTACAKNSPSVLLISVDSMRADELREVFDGQPVAPEMAALADEALEYTDATSSAPWTTPAMMSVFTGMLAETHGVYEHDRTLASSVVTLAQRFQQAGYRTGAFVPAITLHSQYGFERGFEKFVFRDFGHMTPSSAEMTAFVLNWSQQWRDEPSFLWIHMWDPHYNYVPTNTRYDTMFQRGRRATMPHADDVQCLKWVENPIDQPGADYLRGRYEAELRKTDQYIGSIVDFLDQQGLADDTIVAIVGDHGESFLEHGWLGHTNRVDQTLVHVPLIVRAPGREPATIRAPVSTASLGRTLLTLAGLDDDFGLLDGLPLEPAKKDLAAGVANTVRRGCYSSIRSRRFKAVVEQRECTWSLFDLETDPNEQADIAGTYPEVLAELQTALRGEIARGNQARIPKASLPPEVVEKAGDALRSLGYLAGGGGDAGEQGHAEFRCELMPRPDRLEADVFGDLGLPDACPDGGVMRCLEP